MGRPKKQFCVRNHDTFICGRDKWGNCVKCCKEYQIDYYNTNKEKLSQQHREYQNINKVEIAENHKNYMLHRYQTDIEFKLINRLRNRLYLAIKGNSKTSSAIKDLGCSIEELKKYVESKFLPGMTWDNWGEVWELDHIIALWKFDFEDPIQFKQAVHYTNLQPLTKQKKHNNE
jgi:hypothetical protein